MRKAGKKEKPEKWERQLRKEIVKSGFKKEAEDRLVRLLKMEPTPEERKRWEEIGLIYDNKLCISKDEEVDFSVLTLVLWDLTYAGMLEMRTEK